MDRARPKINSAPKGYPSNRVQISSRISCCSGSSRWIRSAKPLVSASSVKSLSRSALAILSTRYSYQLQFAPELHRSDPGAAGLVILDLLDCDRRQAQPVRSDVY